MQSICQSRPSLRLPWISSTTRSYAISVKPPKSLPNKKLPRVFKDKKAFQYNWYSRILNANTTSPILILHHDDFTAQRLKKLRSDIATAALKVQPTLASLGPTPISVMPPALPTLTVVRTSIFGAALRDLPGINLAEVEAMINNQSGRFAVLTLPSLHPPQLNAVLRAMDRSVPPKPPKTEEQIKLELAEKNADPAQPGRRMKRVRQVRIPELRLMGAIIENRVFLPQNLQDVSKLPTLDTLRAQIVGLISGPSAQLAAVLGEASGGRLARTLEGLKKSLEGPKESAPKDDAPTS
ncbi:hypothetical protein BDN70DRAFT_869897 [Pholiota conissans]|uniref:50S ribosomal protein L10 n=1 Tax=Pholiota conissans TaxID=109636 RepID=A0A9P6D874_9AGAR|nr:hypothetical protein BDN70DRAFT_869897 [Pholiota conissans]